MTTESGTTEPLVEVVTTPPVTPPAPPADDQKGKPAATDETAETAAETTEQQEAKRQSKFQRRLDRQKTARVAAETETRLLREQLAKLEGKSAPQAEGEPKREDFQDYETYLRAVAKHDAKQETSQALKTEREERQRGEQQRQATAGQEKIAQDWIEREKSFQAMTKDYVEVVTPFVDEELGSFSDGARRAIVESEVGPQLLHHLASNPEVAERISELSPLRQIAELGKLEDKLSAPVAKKVPGAPPPLKPTPQGQSSSSGISDSDSQQEYEQKRKAQGARWAR